MAGGAGARRTLLVVHVRCKADTAPLSTEPLGGGVARYRACRETHAGTDGKWAAKPTAAAAAAEVEAAAQVAAEAAEVAAEAAEAAAAAAEGAVEGEWVEERVEERVELPPGWRDEGVFWSAPLEWYARWLRATLPRLKQLSAGRSEPVVLLLPLTLTLTLTLTRSQRARRSPMR